MDARTALAALLITAITAPAPQLLAIHKLATTLTPPPATLEVYINNKLTYAQADPPVLNFVYQLMQPIIGVNGHQAIDVKGNSVNQILRPGNVALCESNLDKFKVALLQQYKPYSYTLAVISDIPKIESRPTEVKLTTSDTTVTLKVTAAFYIDTNTTIYGTALLLPIHRNSITSDVLIMYDTLPQPYNAKPGDIITVKYIVEVG